jgi:hypothetical protein
MQPPVTNTTQPNTLFPMKESHIPSASLSGVKRTPLHEEIAQCAHEIWLQSGKPADRDMAIWLEAEQRFILPYQFSSKRTPVLPHGRNWRL